jgi:hypothetical protein
VLVPTRRLAVLAALAAVAVLVLGSETGFWLVNGALVTVAVLDGLLAPPPASVRIERELPEVVTLGARAPLTWTVTNLGARPCRRAPVRPGFGSVPTRRPTSAPSWPRPAEAASRSKG